MSNDNSVNKDRLYFTQCNDTILFQCPECTSTKIQRHCKVFHNFPAVWWHLKQEHKDILESRVDEIRHVLNCVFKAFQWGMFPKWAYSEAKSEPATTSSSILMDGRPPRKDRYENLVKIANLLKMQSQLFPIFRQKNLLILIEKVIGPRDPRI